jgi:hypothetical protein
LFDLTYGFANWGAMSRTVCYTRSAPGPNRARFRWPLSQPNTVPTRRSTAQLAPPQLAPEHYLPALVRPVRLKHLLRNVQPMVAALMPRQNSCRELTNSLLPARVHPTRSESSVRQVPEGNDCWITVPGYFHWVHRASRVRSDLTQNLGLSMFTIGHPDRDWASGRLDMRYCR